MNYKLVLGSEAIRDLKQAVYWYEDQRSGLGDRFAGTVRGTMRRITERPHRYTAIQGDVRRVKVGRWPYLVFYRIRGDLVVVLAILHGRRNPTIWRERAGLD